MARRKRASQKEDPLFIIALIVAVLFLVLDWEWKIALALLLAGIAGVYVVNHYSYLKLLRQSGIEEIDAMDGKAFEQRMELLFRDLGYSVTLTQYSGDYGADLIVIKDGLRTAVQAKRFAKPVGLSAVQEVATAKANYGCGSAIVITNQYFTRPAKKLALANHVALWDRDKLMAMLVKTTRKENL